MSDWTMRVFSASGHIRSLPAVGTLHYVGGDTIPFVNLHGQSDFTKWVPETPKHYYVAAFYGTLK